MVGGAKKTLWPNRFFDIANFVPGPDPWFFRKFFSLSFCWRRQDDVMIIFVAPGKWSDVYMDFRFRVHVAVMCTQNGIFGYMFFVLPVCLCWFRSDLSVFVRFGVSFGGSNVIYRFWHKDSSIGLFLASFCRFHGQMWFVMAYCVQESCWFALFLMMTLSSEFICRASSWLAGVMTTRGFETLLTVMQTLLGSLNSCVWVLTLYLCPIP